jgi:sugar lactone lactonase YvrE
VRIRKTGFMKAIPLIIFCCANFLLKAQMISTFAGIGINGNSGDRGPATAAKINLTGSGVFDTKGNYFFTQQALGTVRKVDPLGIITTIAGPGVFSIIGDGGPATAAYLNFPEGLAIDTADNIYIADHGHCRIRRINKITNVITTYAGSGICGDGGDGGPATLAKFAPADIRFDSRNNLYISDNSSNKIRRISNSGIISTYAGTGIVGFGGDYGPATNAYLSQPAGIAIDTIGNLYFADGQNYRIRKIDTFGIITTIAGNGVGIYSSDGIPATNASFAPVWITIDKQHNVYSTDSNQRVRMIDPSGIIHTIAGIGIGGYSGDGILATTSEIYAPDGVAIDACGNLYIADAWNYRIRKITMPGTTVTPSIVIGVSPGAIVCAGSTVTYTASITGGGSTPSYQWYVNNSIVGSGTNTFSHIPANGDSVSCVLTSSISCASPVSTISNSIKMVVDPVVTPVIFITASPGDTACSGSLVTFNSVVTGGGSAPVYHWFINGSPISAGSSYTYAPANKDSIRCVLTSSSTCASLAYSNTINMVVNPIVMPGISIAPTPGDTVCAGTSVSYAAIITDGGSAPCYKWYVNGSIVGTSTSTFTYVPANGDSVRCELTSSNPCASPAIISSKSVYMVANPIVVPSVAVSVTPGDTVCADISALFSAGITGGGSTPAYQWYVNGSATGAGLNTYSYLPVDGDSIRCVLTSNAICASSGFANSNTVYMVVDHLTPTISLSGISIVSIGSTVTVSATVASTGGSYLIHWLNKGIEFATTAIPLVSYTKASGIDSVTARIIAKSGICYDSAVSDLHVVYSDNTSVKSLGPKRDLLIYPNPVQEEMTIAATCKIATVSINNLVGQSFYLGAFDESIIHVNVAGLPSGLYILKITDNDGAKIVSKFVKE